MRTASLFPLYIPRGAPRYLWHMPWRLIRRTTGKVGTTKTNSFTARRITLLTVSATYGSSNCSLIPALVTIIPYYVLENTVVAPMSACETLRALFQKPAYVRGVKIDNFVATDRCNIMFILIYSTGGPLY